MFISTYKSCELIKTYRHGNLLLLPTNKQQGTCVILLLFCLDLAAIIIKLALLYFIC